MNENENHQNPQSRKPYVSPVMLSIAADEAKEAAKKEEQRKQAEKKQDEQPVKKQPYQPLSFVMGDLSDKEAVRKQETKRPRQTRVLTPEEEMLIAKAASQAAKPDIRMVHGSGSNRKAPDKPKNTANIKPVQTAAKPKQKAKAAPKHKPQQKAAASKPKKPVKKQPDIKPVEQRKPVKPNKPKKRRKNYTLYYAAFGLLATVMLLVLSLTVLFPITDIKVVSSDKEIALSEEQIANCITVSGIQKGGNLLRADTGAAQTNILASETGFDAVRVSRKLPSTVQITVNIAKPEYAFYSAEEKLYYVVSENGRVIQSGRKKELDSDMLYVVGFTVEDCELGRFYDELAVLQNRLTAAEAEVKKYKESSEEGIAAEKARLAAESEIRRYKLFEQLVDKLEECEFSDVTSVDMRRSSDISFTYQKRIKVELGGYTDIDYKLVLAKKIISEELDPDAKGTLNLTVPSLPGFQEDL